MCTHVALLFFTGDSSHSSLWDRILGLADTPLFVLHGDIRRQRHTIARTEKAASGHHDLSLRGFSPLQASFPCSSWSDALGRSHGVVFP